VFRSFIPKELLPREIKSSGTKARRKKPRSGLVSIKNLYIFVPKCRDIYYAKYYGDEGK